MKDFPKIFEDNTLLGYGNYFDYDFGEDKRKTEIELCKKVLSKPEWQNALGRENYSAEEILSDFTYNMHQTAKNLQGQQLNSKRTLGQSSWVGYKVANLQYSNSFKYNSRKKVWQTTDNAIRDDLFVTHCAVAFSKVAKTNEQINNEYAWPIATGFHFSTGNKPAMFSIATHELGHCCLYRLGKFMSDQEWQDFWQLTDHARKLYRKGEISEYAKTDRHEQVAEAFSDWYCRGDNATTHNKKLVKFLKGVYNRVYGIKEVS